ncbi:DALR anticodon-binding domain-containing protein 3 isoform X2 [Trachypithecus francoisi]|uniref:DALR anticodon-binding domain-containing protein 3 isoform X2 n=1 Tax=Trachypithecus francoisi TaxID=54180 RepID=UPI00141ACC72|nr:DALR anticodon-binding domain-containing protein 3 isoform X2 [Trachypithecus francoisi]
MATRRLGVGETLGALNAALGPGCTVWIKETRARHLRSRDFLAPHRALQARFDDGQVPEHLLHVLACLQGPGVAPVLRCAPTPAGLSLQLQRPAVFERVLSAVAAYATPASPALPGQRVLLHCPALRSSACALRLSQLRTVLVADHLARALRAHGVCVRLVPAVQDPHMLTFLQQLRVDWPAASERASSHTLRSHALEELISAHDGRTLSPGILGRLCLKELVEEQGRTAGYDPNLNNCLVTEDLLSVLAELQEALWHWPEDSHPGLAGAPDTGTDSCLVVHVVSCEEEFQQQKLDLLWQKLVDKAPLRQKHLICGPVKVTGAPGPLMTAPEYYNFRHAQVCKASALKHGGDLAQDPGWTEIFGVLSVATIKFEMLSTAPQSQLFLALADNISTKGTKSGTFVMYNCARLATLFESYKCSMEQGLYPTFPPVSSLDFSLLHDEGEWLLLFNNILPFPDLLSQTAMLDCTAPGLHITAHTEMMCKFLVQLSMDFSSYYNRVHILGVSTQHNGLGRAERYRVKTKEAEDETSRPLLFQEPRPHRFGQMFVRLQLLRAVREVLHTGLAMLGLPPLSHI